MALRSERSFAIYSNFYFTPYKLFKWCFIQAIFFVDFYDDIENRRHDRSQKLWKNALNAWYVDRPSNVFGEN